MEYPKVCLRRGEEAGVLKGQRLIYDNELDWADDVCTDGCVVDVLDNRQRFAARGFFNSRSRLTVRVLTRDEAEPIDRAFFARRIEAAQKLLETTELSIGSVAEQTGFASAAHFRRVFRETMGVGPLQYRKSRK